MVLRFVGFLLLVLSTPLLDHNASAQQGPDTRRVLGLPQEFDAEFLADHIHENLDTLSVVLNHVSTGFEALDLRDHDLVRSYIPRFRNSYDGLGTLFYSRVHESAKFVWNPETARIETSVSGRPLFYLDFVPDNYHPENTPTLLVVGGMNPNEVGSVYASWKLLKDLLQHNEKGTGDRAYRPNPDGRGNIEVNNNYVQPHSTRVAYIPLLNVDAWSSWVESENFVMPTELCPNPRDCEDEECNRPKELCYPRKMTDAPSSLNYNFTEPGVVSHYPENRFVETIVESLDVTHLLVLRSAGEGRDGGGFSRRIDPDGEVDEDWIRRINKLQRDWEIPRADGTTARAVAHLRGKPFLLSNKGTHNFEGNLSIGGYAEAANLPCISIGMPNGSVGERLRDMYDGEIYGVQYQLWEALRVIPENWNSQSETCQGFFGVRR